MRIAYLCHTRFPTERAYGRQIARVVASLKDLGHDVALLAPDVTNAIAETPEEYYGLGAPLGLVRLDVRDPRRWLPEVLWQPATDFFFGRAVRRWLREHPVDAVYVRAPSLLRALRPHLASTILELHALPALTPGTVALLRSCRLVACLTSLQRDVLEAAGVPRERLHVAPDAVDLERFAALPPAADAKAAWSLPADVPVLGYCGSLVTQTTIEKGVDVLVRMSAELKKRGRRHLVWIVGGPREWVDRYSELALRLGVDDTVRFQGDVRSADVPRVLAACDACLYPAPASAHPYFVRDTSPLKIFEYLAAGKPIVACDLPPLHDVLSDDTCVFCPPGDAAGMADATASVLDDPEGARRRAEAGKAVAARHTWKARSEAVMRAAFPR